MYGRDIELERVPLSREGVFIELSNRQFQINSFIPRALYFNVQARIAK
jgi:hypothetical protein